MYRVGGTSDNLLSEIEVIELESYYKAHTEEMKVKEVKEYLKSFI